jgi:hypothetical protein
MSSCGHPAVPRPPGTVLAGDQPLLVLAHLRNARHTCSPGRRLRGLDSDGVTAVQDGVDLLAALPGATHDLTAPRTHGLVEALISLDVEVFADRAYQGAGARSGHRSSIIRSAARSWAWASGA